MLEVGEYNEWCDERRLSIQARLISDAFSLRNMLTNNIVFSVLIMLYYIKNMLTGKVKKATPAVTPERG